MKVAPVAEGEEAAASTEPFLACHPTWQATPTYVELENVTSVEVKVDGRYRPVVL